MCVSRDIRLRYGPRMRPPSGQTALIIFSSSSTTITSSSRSLTSSRKARSASSSRPSSPCRNVPLIGFIDTTPSIDETCRSGVAPAAASPGVHERERPVGPALVLEQRAQPAEHGRRRRGIRRPGELAADHEVGALAAADLVVDHAPHDGGVVLVAHVDVEVVDDHRMPRQQRDGLVDRDRLALAHDEAADRRAVVVRGEPALAHLAERDEREHLGVRRAGCRRGGRRRRTSPTSTSSVGSCSRWITANGGASVAARSEESRRVMSVSGRALGRIVRRKHETTALGRSSYVETRGVRLGGGPPGAGRRGHVEHSMACGAHRAHRRCAGHTIRGCPPTPIPRSSRACARPAACSPRTRRRCSPRPSRDTRMPRPSSRRSSPAGWRGSRSSRCSAGRSSRACASLLEPGVFVPRRRTELLAAEAARFAARDRRRGSHPRGARPVLRCRRDRRRRRGCRRADRARRGRHRPGRGAGRATQPRAARRPRRRGRPVRCRCRTTCSAGSTCSRSTRPTCPPTRSR